MEGEGEGGFNAIGEGIFELSNKIYRSSEEDAGRDVKKPEPEEPQCVRLTYYLFLSFAKTLTLWATGISACLKPEADIQSIFVISTIIIDVRLHPEIFVHLSLTPMEQAHRMIDEVAQRV